MAICPTLYFKHFLVWCFRLSFFFFFGHTHGMWKFSGKGMNPSHSSNPSHSNNTRSLSHWATRELQVCYFWKHVSRSFFPMWKPFNLCLSTDFFLFLLLFLFIPTSLYWTPPTRVFTPPTPLLPSIGFSLLSPLLL